MFKVNRPTIVDVRVEAQTEDLNSFETFKKNIFSVIDKMTSELNRRFADRSKKTIRGIDALTPSSDNFLDEHAIKDFADEYSSLLAVEYIGAELANPEQVLKRKKESESGDCPESLLQLQCYMHRLRDAFVEFYTVFQKSDAKIQITITTAYQK